jgi:transcriptional regulator with XRE-family HTH domain
MIRIPYDADLGKVINDLMTLNGVRQAELARMTGFTDAQISEWRHGKVKPDTATVLRVFRALGYELALIPLEGA